MKLAHIRRWLKFALSRKTRNRSRASKEAWARKKAKLIGAKIVDDFIRRYPNYPEQANTAAQASPSVAPADSSHEDAAGLAAAVPITNTTAREPSHHDDMSAIPESGSKNRAEPAPVVPDAAKENA